VLRSRRRLADAAVRRRRKTELPHQKLRVGLLGYRRADVHRALERQHEQIARLAGSLDRAWTDRARAVTELAEARAALDELHAAHGTAAEIVAHAERQAAFLRAQTERYVGEGGRRLQELMRAREHLVAEMRAVVETASLVIAAADQAARERPPLPAPAVLATLGSRAAAS
jgi:hypothetical protein